MERKKKSVKEERTWRKSRMERKTVRHIDKQIDRKKKKERKKKIIIKIPFDNEISN